MYSLRLICEPEERDFAIAELWERGTSGVRELEDNGRSVLIAGFDTGVERDSLLIHFASYSPEWQREATDWEAVARNSWPAREIGERIFLAPTWSDQPTPTGRLRITHNPGLACGTGEHACTRMAMVALERYVRPGSFIVDVGTGSAILAIAARTLGAKSAIGLDTDEAALGIAKENSRSNEMEAILAAGSADCLADECADLTAANISGTVLLSILDELIRITRPDGWLILTGFPDTEQSVFERIFAEMQVLAEDEWRCVIARPQTSLCV